MTCSYSSLWNRILFVVSDLLVSVWCVLCELCLLEWIIIMHMTHRSFIQNKLKHTDIDCVRLCSSLAREIPLDLTRFLFAHRGMSPHRCQSEWLGGEMTIDIYYSKYRESKCLGALSVSRNRWIMIDKSRAWEIRWNLFLILFNINRVYSLEFLCCCSTQTETETFSLDFRRLGKCGKMDEETTHSKAADQFWSQKRRSHNRVEKSVGNRVE